MQGKYRHGAVSAGYAKLSHRRAPRGSGCSRGAPLPSFVDECVNIDTNGFSESLKGVQHTQTDFGKGGELCGRIRLAGCPPLPRDIPAFS